MHIFIEKTGPYDLSGLAYPAGKPTDPLPNINLKNGRRQRRLNGGCSAKPKRKHRNVDLKTTKTMKKFKVIEKSRFLTQKEKEDVRGSIKIEYCSVVLPYASNPCAPYVTCGMPSVKDYWNCGSSAFFACGSDVAYSTTGGSCGTVAAYSATCGVGFVYN